MGTSNIPPWTYFCFTKEMSRLTGQCQERAEIDLSNGPRFCTTFYQLNFFFFVIFLTQFILPNLNFCKFAIFTGNPRFLSALEAEKVVLQNHKYVPTLTQILKKP